MLAVPPCRVLQVPSATHGALWWVLSATHPGVLAVLPAQHPSAGCAPGRVVGVGTTHLARRVLGGCWVAPSEGFVGAVGHSWHHRRVRAHLSISPGHPWASLGACSCCTWEGKVFTWEN